MKRKNKKQIYILGFLIIFIILLIVFRWPHASLNVANNQNPDASSTINSFSDCASAGFPVLESYPRQCSVPNGPIFIEDLLPAGETPSGSSTLTYKDLLRVDNLQAGASIASPLKITGEARGSWYFEGSFPVLIEDSDGKVIGQGAARAQGEWTTTEYVPFEANITFDNPGGVKTGEIILKKDNPSGDPVQDDSFNIPVYFEK